MLAYFVIIKIWSCAFVLVVFLRGICDVLSYVGYDVFSDVGYVMCVLLAETYTLKGKENKRDGENSLHHSTE